MGIIYVPVNLLRLLTSAHLGCSKQHLLLAYTTFTASPGPHPAMLFKWPPSSLSHTLLSFFPCPPSPSFFLTTHSPRQLTCSTWTGLRQLKISSRVRRTCFPKRVQCVWSDKGGKGMLYIRITWLLGHHSFVEMTYFLGSLDLSLFFVKNYIVWWK